MDNKSVEPNGDLQRTHPDVKGLQLDLDLCQNLTLAGLKGDSHIDLRP